jgi:hypothetical protein
MTAIDSTIERSCGTHSNNRANRNACYTDSQPLLCLYTYVVVERNKSLLPELSRKSKLGSRPVSVGSYSLSVQNKFSMHAVYSPDDVRGCPRTLSTDGSITQISTLLDDILKIIEIVAVLNSPNSQNPILKQVNV